MADVKIYEKCSSVKDCEQIVEQLPSSSKNLLLWLVKLMASVSSNANVNLMNTTNCATLIAPNLFTIEDINEYNHLLPYIQSFCDILITSYMSCFVCLPIAMNVV